VHAVLTSETRGILDTTAFVQMAPEAALIDGIDAGTIVRGAA
jgi:phosphoglycerate dehydrogenase-like enzyme